ncbi:MAG: oxidoreductase [Verrucomicrobia bacterium]|nr:MAG: oxidoreductase [Verrucomicrobiota bacterium]
MAWSDLKELTKLKELRLVAVAEVDLKRTAELKKAFPDVKVYQDWRKLLEEEGKNIDSVNVSTPDHMHAVMAMSAMQLGKHVYGQKPLAHDLHEVRKLAEFSRRKGLVTQMSIQIHSAGHYRMASRLVQDGAIGKVKEVHSWCPKSWGDTAPRPDTSDPVPQDFDWDLWLGVCAPRPFIGKGYYHPVNWRKRLDFGTGTFGDMGCHIFDPVFDALGLSAPISVRSEGPAPNQWNWALDSRIHYVFSGTTHTAEKTISVTWYDGASKPPPEIVALLEGDELPNTGSIFVGTKGVMVLPHINRPLLYPDKEFKDFKYPQVPSGDHWGEFVQACRGQGRTSAHFGYAGPLTEAVLLGGVASRFPQTTLKWNPREMRFDQAEANQYVRREYRRGWEVKALA